MKKLILCLTTALITATSAQAQYVRKVVSDRHLLGIEMTTWMPTIPEKREALEDAVRIMKEAGTL